MELVANTFGGEVVMSPTAQESLNLNSEERAVLAELLESEHTRLLVEIRHTQSRAFREELRHRLTLIESLAGRCRLT